MKESKTLKITAYILIPILIAIIVITGIYETVKTQNDEWLDSEAYFSSNNFVDNYMAKLSNFAEQLIYKRENYNTVYNYDNSTGENIEIRYTEYEDTMIKNFYFMIRYKNIVLTNVEFTANTDTVEKIKTYISALENSQKVNIVGGNIEATSEKVSNRATRKFSNFNIDYYTKDLVNEESITNEENFEDNLTDAEMAEKGINELREVNCNIFDFSIYSSYEEVLLDNEERAMVSNIFEKLQFFDENICMIIPVSSVLLILCIVYLVISIGHSKGVDGIDINDFDKIYLELIGIVAFFGILFTLLICAGVDEALNIFQNLNFFISAIIAGYLICYTICAVCANTVIKRIKAKTFWKSTLVYKFYKITISRFRNVWNSLDNKNGKRRKLVISALLYSWIIVFFAGAFGEFGVIIDVLIIIYVVYKILKKIRNFEQIESHLKDIYDGNNQSSLNPEEFEPEFQNEVKYINDISNGFENAIQDRIKSERLKTELITNVSHDIKTPLTSIINYVDLLKKEQIENEKAKEYIEVLDNKSQRLKKLTEDLIEASKVSSGNIKLNVEKINVVELINQALGEFEDKFKKFEIITNFEENQIFINADNRYMYRIIENIFSNVSKYALENSRVYIDIFSKDDKVYIVEKNISKEKLNISEEELMQRFVRGDKSRTTEGNGLGISISKSLTEVQNGQFDVKIDGDLFRIEICFKIA